MLGFVAIRIARSRLESVLSSALGAPVSIGGLRVSLRADVGLSDIAIGADGGGPTIDDIDVDPDLRRVLRGELVLNRIALHGVHATLDLTGQAPVVQGIPAGTGGSSAAPIPVRELVVRDSEITTLLPPAIRRTPGKLAIGRLLAWQVPTTESDAAGFVATIDGAVDGLPVQAQATADIGTREYRIDAAAEIAEMPIEAAAVPLPPSLASLQGTLGGRVDYHRDSAADRAVLSAELQAIDVTAVLASGISLDAKRVAFGGLEIEPRRGWAWHGDRIEVAGGRISLGAGEKPVALEVQTMVLHDVGRDSPGTGDIVGRLGESGALHATGKLGLDPLTTDLRIDLAKVSLPELADAFGPLPLGIARGTADGRITVAGDLERYRLSGALELSQVHTRAPDATRPEEVLAVDRMEATFVYAPEEKTALSLSKVVLHDPYAMVERRTGGLFPLSELSGSSEEPSPSATPAQGSRASTSSRSGPSPSAGTRAQIAASDLPVLAPPATVADAGSPAADSGAPTGGASAASPAAGTAEPAQAPLRISVADLQISAGRIDYLDTTLTPTYWSGLSSLSGSVSALAWPDLTFSQLKLSGLHDELSAVRIVADSPRDRLSAQATADGLLLPTFNPYLSPLIGYRLDSGTATLNVEGALLPESFDGRVRLALENLGVVQTGLDVVDRETGVPLPVALALMKDLSGKVELTVPVQGDPRSGSLQLGSIFSQAFGRAILAAITSPLRLLGMLFGSDGPPHALSIDPVPFPVGEGSLDAAGKDRIFQIRRILGSHPELVLIAKPQLSAADRAAVGTAHLAALAADRAAAVRQGLIGGGATGAAAAVKGAITHAIESASQMLHPGATPTPAPPPGQAAPPIDASRVTITPWKADENPGGDPLSGVYVELQATR